MIKYNTGETSEELRQKYNPEGSKRREVQKRMLDMLLYVKDVCERNNIEWMIAFGNVLGAERHGGFIPWDDDIDIVLDYKNHKKLCDILKHSNHSQYVLQDHDTDNGYYLHFPKLRDLKSEYILSDAYHNNLKYKGFQIDIFLMERGALLFPYMIMAKCTAFNLFHLAGRGIVKDMFAKGLFFIQSKILIPVCRLLSLLWGDPKLFSVPYGSFSGWGLKYVSKDDIFPYKPISFEGVLFPGPANPDKYLKSLYGDYMSLPPQDKRVGHEAGFILL